VDLRRPASQQQALGCYGDPNVHTPNIDRLASHGVRCLNGIGGSPLCSPYRGVLLSGRYCHHSVPGHQYPLDPSLPTIATPFNEAGYHTAYFGKWHVDGFEEKDGRAAFHKIEADRRGSFKQWLGYENNNAQWDCWVHGHDAQGHEIPHYRLPGFETDELTNLTVDFIREQAAKQQETDAPFFAVLSVQPPHDPYEAPAEWMGRHTPGQIELRPNVPEVGWVVERARRDLAGYYAMVENLDWNVGRIMYVLAETDLFDDTHIIFFSDHGDCHGSHGQFRKTNPFEESVKVPMILSGGRRYVHKSGSTDIPINHVDLGPTSLGLCGIEAPDWMQGTDRSHLRVRDRAVPDVADDAAYCQIVVPTGHGDSCDRAWRGLVTRDGWKYICMEHQPWLMFNLNEDPYEQVNMAHNTAFGRQRKELHDRLTAFAGRVGDTDFAFPQL
jgi:arylsulfatase A-like enzyme